ncbi:hypothetical protein [Clostridium folliculivorans]|uniref:Lipoprotein n=1 Tax=Clostridium folliculivorans TaxID=2886038 RepID=A0A9W6DA82_9CLOT|nr:hypothetical protein [Clostridium folliculivorans]GKU24929.1 hypothetical protein CFOLD11_17550 [Clostridium folliculivorans]GKU31027.1 hypothetical protein CFB3_31340 [Clostridium folliculivorans]
MKKFINSFLILCTLMITQPCFHNEVSARPTEENPTIHSTFQTYDQNSIPRLLKSEQISANQIKITYDRDVDKSLAEQPTNYWIKDLKNEEPEGIATVGQNCEADKSNSLTRDIVKIESKNGLGNVYILTFKNNIPKGEQYKLVICNVTVEGAQPYNGDNGASMFAGKF